MTNGSWFCFSRYSGGFDGSSDGSIAGRKKLVDIRYCFTLVFASVSILVLAAVVGCQRPARDLAADSSKCVEGMTPSAKIVRVAESSPRVSHRSYQPTEVRAIETSLSRSPLYFEDPFERTDGYMDASAATGVDYGYLAYGPVRFLVSVGLYPVSVVVSPPWIIESDAALGD